MSVLNWKIGDLVEFRFKKGGKSKLGIYLGITNNKHISIAQNTVNIILIAEEIKILEVPFLYDDLFYTRVVQSFSGVLG